MKKVLIIVLAMAILAAAGIALAAISSSPHDVRTLKGNSSLEPCAFCHTPHQGSISTYPLWNRSQTAQTYTVYTSGTFNMGPANASLDSGSVPCMVCHNGVTSTLVNYPGRGSVANSNYDGTIATFKSPANTWANLGLDLQNEHPVSFTYNAAADTTNNFPAAVNGAITGVVSSTSYPLFGQVVGGSKTQFSCATCHAVHDTAVYASKGSNPGQVYFLRVSNAGSQMCRDCHQAK